MFGSRCCWCTAGLLIQQHNLIVLGSFDVVVGGGSCVVVLVLVRVLVIDLVLVFVLVLVLVLAVVGFPVLVHVLVLVFVLVFVLVVGCCCQYRQGRRKRPPNYIHVDASWGRSRPGHHLCHCHLCHYYCQDCHVIPVILIKVVNNTVTITIIVIVIVVIVIAVAVAVVVVVIVIIVIVLVIVIVICCCSSLSSACLGSSTATPTTVPKQDYQLWQKFRIISKASTSRQ